MITFALWSAPFCEISKTKARTYTFNKLILREEIIINFIYKL